MGVAGSGKSYCALGIACQHLVEQKTEKIIILRPIVAVGRDLGSMPGVIDEKIEPYFWSVRSILIDILGKTQTNKFLKDKSIEFMPVELIRGMTFNNSYVVVEEVQNLSFHQLKTLLTRIGENTKVVLNGDLSQSDTSKNSKTVEDIIYKIREIDGIEIHRFNQSVRSKLVNLILKALDS